ncbi:ATP-binding protein [Bacteroides sp.]|uniref:ATP-binding protein n=1 Tax=Bacteroides sp. TaxID=29523 RepID=UPI0026216166|nr:ATP-binding protein [Bacteroides sp.]MDD3039809.1 ATP-binding protein [Bacteroides sp.]
MVNDYILIINSYTEATPWSVRMISTVTEYTQNLPQLGLYTEHMNLLMMDNDAVLQEFKDTIFTKYKHHPPRIILLLGNSALMLRDDIRKEWGDIPIMLCGEEDYFGPQKSYLEKKPIALSDRIPVTELAKPYNLVFLYSDLFIRENIELVCQMIPNMKKFIFIGDGQQINQTNNLVIQEELAKKHPDVTYQFLSPEKIVVNQLMDSLYAIDSKTTGVLYSSWSFKQTFAGNTSLSTNSHNLIGTTSAPLFAIGLITLKDYRGGMIGGYGYDQDVYNAKITQIIEEILEGKQARDIPFYLPSDGAPIMNYEVLKRKGIPLSFCPEGTIFFNRPPTFWEQYNYFLLGTIVCIILLILFFQYRIHHLNNLKKAQKKEIEVMATYRNLINNMPILYMQEELITNEKGEPVDLIYRNVNSFFEKNFYPKEKVIGRNASEIFPESMQEFLHFIKISLDENRAITFPYYFKQIDTFYDVVLKGTNQSNIIDIFCVDSTELHKVQQKLSATNNKLAMALDVANIVPWKWDLLSKTILCDINRPIELSTQENDVNEEQLAVPDSQYFAKIFKEDRERVEKAYDDLVEGRSDKVKEEYRVVTVNNHLHSIDWVEAQAAVETRDENGKPITLVGSSLVITKRKKMEMELTTARDRAEESNRLKSAFLANMSHEIRTPLNAIVGFSGILASTDEEQEKQEYVSIIENNNTLLLQLISDILDLSKIEAGTLEFQYSDIELNTTMSELVNSLRFKLKSDKVQLNFIPNIESCFIHTEKNRLSQLLINLITNAIKFTTEGSINFGYELRDKEVYFYVTDTGCGIPYDKQKNIFARFVKLNNFAQGTGLGLSICQTLVEHMGGSIGVESEEGKGSTFWFTLPYKPANATDDSIKKNDIEPITIEKNKFTILIAEDNESNYKLFASILKEEYQLIHAWNGEEAVEMFKKYNPQIILMDINMPVMDGYEATREIRKYSAKVPIIAVTAFAYASDEQKVMENGFDGYMPKPINARQLKAQLTDIMKKRIILL